MADPTPEELERFFFLNEAALKIAWKKRRRHNRLGWAVQWGTVRMLGTFLEDPLEVPQVMIGYAAEQLGVDDPSCIKQYAERVPTQYEHAREIRDVLGFRDFSEAEEEITELIASRVARMRNSRRELFDRAVLGLIEGQVLLPGISTLAWLVRDVHRDGLPRGVHVGDDRVGTCPDQRRRSRLLGDQDDPQHRRRRSRWFRHD